MKKAPDTSSDLQELRKVQANKKCFDCNQAGTTYAIPELGIFLCSICGGIHREFNHRVKGLSTCNFSEAEVSKLKAVGNERASSIWLAKHDSRLNPIPDIKDSNRLKDFLRLKYIERRFYENKEPVKDQTEERRPSLPVQEKSAGFINLIDDEAPVVKQRDLTPTRENQGNLFQASFPNGTFQSKQGPQNVSLVPPSNMGSFTGSGNSGTSGPAGPAGPATGQGSFNPFPTGPASGPVGASPGYSGPGGSTGLNLFPVNNPLMGQVNPMNPGPVNSGNPGYSAGPQINTAYSITPQGNPGYSAPQGNPGMYHQGNVVNPVYNSAPPQGMQASYPQNYNQTPMPVGGYPNPVNQINFNLYTGHPTPQGYPVYQGHSVTPPGIPGHPGASFPGGGAYPGQFNNYPQGMSPTIVPNKQQVFFNKSSDPFEQLIEEEKQRKIMQQASRNQPTPQQHLMMQQFSVQAQLYEKTYGVPFPMTFQQWLSANSGAPEPRPQSKNPFDMFG
jgi:Arf-GAP domain and FG repeat-containing protein 1